MADDRGVGIEYIQGLRGYESVAAPVTAIEDSQILTYGVTSEKRFVDFYANTSIVKNAVAVQYTVRENSKFLSAARKADMRIYASNLSTVDTTNNTIPTGVTELPVFPYGKTGRFSSKAGPQHSKTIVADYVPDTNKVVVSMHTGAFTDTTLSQRNIDIGLVLEKSNTIARQAFTNTERFINRKPIYSQRDVIAFSPQDKSGKARIEHVFTNENKNNVITISSATQTSVETLKLVASVLKEGGHVRVAESGESSDGDMSGETLAKQNFKEKLEFIAKYSKGTVEWGTKRESNIIEKLLGRDKVTHYNALVKGDIFFLGTPRNSKSTQENFQETDQGYLLKNKNVAKFLEEQILKDYNFEILPGKANLYAYETGFIGYVNEEFESNRGNVIVQAQTSAQYRNLMRQQGSRYLNNSGGILTSSLLAYKQSELNVSVFSGVTGQTYASSVNPEDYRLLEEIQNEWRTSSTLGESLGQLGSRGLISSAIVNIGDFIDKSDFFKATKEELEYRFQFSYRKKPVEEYQHMFADFARSSLDGANSMIGNLVGFYTASKAYSLLVNTGRKGVVNILKSASGLNTNPSVSGISKFFLKSFEFIGMLARGATAGLTFDVLSPISSAIDSLVGMTNSEGSLQIALDRTSVKMMDSSISGSKLNIETLKASMKVASKNIVLGFFNTFTQGVEYASKALTGPLKGVVKLFTGPEVRRYVRSPGFKLKQNARLIKDRLFYKESAHRSRPELNYLLKDWKKISAVGVLGLFFLDNITGFIGEHIGGVDAMKIDRANLILEEAANRAHLHPVQIAKTANTSYLNFTGNPILDTSIFALRVPANLVKASWESFWDMVGSSNRIMLGTNIIEKGQEIQAAQKAALMGNKKLAEIYMYMSSGGKDLYENDTFKSDMWKSWVFQISPMPLVATLTLSMSQHKSSEAVFGSAVTAREVQEFGFTLQGPVFLTIGVSPGLPFQMSREFDNKTEKQLSWERGAWAFSYKPGSTFINALGAVTLLNAMSLTFNSVKQVAASVLKTNIAVRLDKAGYKNLSGVAEGVAEVWQGHLDSRDHRFTVDPTKPAKRGAVKILPVKAISPLKAAGVLLSLPATLPIQAVISVMSGAKTAYQMYRWKGSLNLFSDPALGLSVGTDKEAVKTFENFQQLAAKAQNQILPFSGTRFQVHDELIKVSGGAVLDTQEKFNAHFGLSKDDKKASAAFKAYKSLLNPKFGIKSIFQGNTVSPNKFPLIPNQFLAKGKLGVAAVFLGTVTALSLAAGQNKYKDSAMQSNFMFSLANKTINYAASLAQLNRADIAKRRASFIYQMAETLPYDTAPGMLRGFLAAVRGIMHVLDPHGGFRNLQQIFFGGAAEAFLFPMSGSSTDKMKWNSETQIYELKKGVSLTPGPLSLLTHWATGLLKAFADSFYFSQEQHPYLQIGPMGLVKKRTDKDTDTWAGYFTQGGIFMFLTSGYAEQFVFREGWQKRQYQEWKYANKQLYTPLGLRQLMRDNPVRTSKMFRDDPSELATTWGVRTELLRRSHLFSQIKHVDATDLLFMPGLHTLSKDSLASMKTRMRIFRELKNTKDAAFQAIVEQFLPDVSKLSSSAPGSLDGSDNNIEFVQGMYDAKAITDWFGRDYSYTGPNISENILRNPVFGSAVLLGIGAGALSVVGAFVDSAIDPINVNMTVQNLKEKMGLQSANYGEKYLKRIRSYSVRSRMVALLDTDTGDGRGPLRLLSIGSGNEETLYIKGKRYPGQPSIDIDKMSAQERRNLEWNKVMWGQDEIGDGPITSVRKSLNRISQIENKLAKIYTSQSARFGDIRSLRTGLQELSNELDKLMKGSVGAELSELQGAFDKVKKSQESLIDFMKTINDSNATAQQKIDALKKALSLNDNIQGKTLKESIDSVNSAVSGLGQRVVKRLVDSEILSDKEIGLAKSSGLRSFLQKLGVKFKTFLEIHEIADYEMEHAQQTIGKSDASSRINSFADQPFAQEFRRRVDLQVLSDIAEQIQDPDIQKALNQVLEETEFLSKMQEQTLGNAAANDSIKTGNARTDDASSVERALRERALANGMTAEKYEELVGNKLTKIRAKAKTISSLSIMRDFFGQGIEINLLGNSKTISFIGGIGYGLFAYGFYQGVVKPFQKMSVIASQSRNIRLTAESSRQLRETLYDSQAEFHGGIAGFAAGAFVASQSAKKLFSFTKALIQLKNVAAALNVAAVGATALAPETGGASLFGSLALAALSTGVGFVADLGVRYVEGLAGASHKQRVGESIQKRGAYFGLIDFSWERAIENNNYFEKESKRLAAKKIKGNLKGVEVPWEWLVNGTWNPSQLETPQGGLLRNFLTDPIFSAKKENIGLLADSFSKMAGYSPSINSGSVHGAFFSKSVFWVGNEYDLIQNVLAPNQNYLMFEDTTSYTSTNLHPSSFGILSPAKQVAPTKSGIDVLGETWMRDEYRSHLFRPANLVSSMGIQTELNRRSEIFLYNVSALVDQRAYMQKVAKAHSKNDPRSGVGLPGDAFIFVQPTGVNPFYGFIQPKYHNPLFNSSPSDSSDYPVYRGSGVNQVKTKDRNKPQERTNPDLSSADKKISALPAKQVNKSPATRAAEAVIAANIKKEAQRSKKQKEDVRTHAIIASAEPERRDNVELSQDTCISQNKQTKFAQRQITRYGDNKILISKYKIFDRNDVETLKNSDTFDTGFDSQVQDTFG